MKWKKILANFLLDKGLVLKIYFKNAYNSVTEQNLIGIFPKKKE